MDKANNGKVYALIEHYKVEYEGEWEYLLCVFKDIPTAEEIYNVINGIDSGINWKEVDEVTSLTLNSSIFSRTAWGDEVGLEIREMDLL